MKNMILPILALFILLISCSTEEPTPTPTPTPDPEPILPPPTFTLPVIEDVGYFAPDSLYDGWTPTFSEDFDTDLSQWTPWRGGAFNNELQHYQASNLFVENGFLYIRAKRGSVTGRTNPFDETMKSFGFSSGRIESIETFGPKNFSGQRTVRISARLRLVEGDGLWPAFWTYNDPWPTKGEIDMLEARGNTPFEFQTNFHFGKNANQLDTDPAFNEFHYTHDTKLTESFHLYEIEWSQNAFVILFDGQVIKTYDVETYAYVDDFFNKDHRITLNLAVGGFFFQNLDESQIPDDSYMVVDWVKVHTK